MRKEHRFACVWVVALAWLTVTCGCTSNTGPAKFSLSGNVTFDGQPVPSGSVRLTPDKEAGNSGPGTVAPIENGRYETPSDKGIIGGPHVVEIIGMGADDGESSEGAAELFPRYTEKIDFPAADGQHDFNITKEAEAAP